MGANRIAQNLKPTNDHVGGRNVHLPYCGATHIELAEPYDQPNMEEDLTRSRRRHRRILSRSSGHGGGILPLRRQGSPPSKRTKWEDANLLHNVNVNNNATAVTTVACCELQPWIETLMNSDPCDLVGSMGILQQIKSRLEMIHDVEEENGTTGSTTTTTTIDRASLLSLPRLLMVRLGYYHNHEEQQPSIPIPLATRLYILVLTCWKACLERTQSSSAAQRMRRRRIEQGDPDVTIMGFRIVLELLERVVEWCGATKLCPTPTSDPHEVTTNWTTEMGTVVEYCIDLLETWLDSGEGTTSTSWSITTTDRRQRPLLEDLAIVLIQIAHLASAPGNDEQDLSNVVSTTIQAFFDMQQQQQQQQQQHRSWSVFDIARRILCKERMVPGDESLSVDDRLFWIRCQSVVPHTSQQPDAVTASPELDQQMPYIFSILHSQQSTLESKAQAARVLICSLHRTTLEKIQESIQIALVLQNTYHRDHSVFTSLLLQSLLCVEKALVQSTNLPSTWPTLLDLGMTIALDGPLYDYKIANQAGMTVLALVSLGIPNDRLLPVTKGRLFQAIRRMMESSPRRPVVARSQALICTWMETSSSRRQEILQLCPELLVSLARFISSRRAAPRDILAILHAFSTLLETEPTNNHMAREPAIVEAVVTMTTVRTTDSSETLMTEDIRKEAMKILLCLSENPCNRRILAKHPGLLASMIHVARHLPPDSILEPPAIESQSHLSADMKRHILLLAQAL